MCALRNRKGASGSVEYFGSIDRNRTATELRASSATCDQPATRASGVLQVLANMFNNADLAGVKETRRSTTGIKGTFADGAMSWTSRLQNLQPSRQLKLRSLQQV
jgi:hypothetical protein